MVKTLALAVLLVSGAAVAHADLLEVSGFGGYTSLNMGQVNTMLASPKSVGGVMQTKTTDISSGYMAGLDVRSGAIIPIPFLEVGLKGEYLGANNPGEAAGNDGGQEYDIKETPSLVAAMLGLDFSIHIPATPLKLGLSAYGGYGEGVMQQSVAPGTAVPLFTDYYRGGGFVGELEGRVDCNLFSVLSVYGFGGYRMASIGTFADSAGAKFNFGVNNAAAPDVNFSGVTAGGGLNFDF